MRETRSGICRYCLKETGGLTMHERYCLQRDENADLRAIDAFITRASAHADARPNRAQRWMHSVQDNEVAAVFFAMEHDAVTFDRNEYGRWRPSKHINPSGRKVSIVVSEMLRTGLLRLADAEPNTIPSVLIPARVHLRDGRQTACRYHGEGLGSLRMRLVDDLALVDCLECEATVGRGGYRGL